MLALDAAKGHLTWAEKTIKKRNNDLEFLPGGKLPQLQVFKIVVNKPYSKTTEKLRMAFGRTPCL